LPKLSSLEALRAFVETGSVSKAAERLGRTQPQAGRMLKALEEELGLTLFMREGRRLTLTLEGHRIHQQAEHLLAGHDKLASLAARLRDGPKDNHLHILIAPQMASTLLRQPLAAMVKAVPGFSATIQARLRLDVETLLEQEDFDVGLTVPLLNHPGLRIETVCDVEAVIAMPVGHRLARRAVVRPSDLAGLDLISTHPRSVLRMALEQSCRHIGITPHIRFESANGTTACQLVAMGLGVALADPFVARSSGATGLVLRRFEPKVSLRYGLFQAAGQQRADLAQRFCTLLSRHVKAQAAALARELESVRPGRVSRSSGRAPG